MASRSEFLDGLLRVGAFQGRIPREAYFVRCHRSTPTQDDIDHGRLIVMVGVAPLKPAEFVILRIGQWRTSEVTEPLGPVIGAPRLELSLSRRPVWPEGFLLQVEGPRGWTVWGLVEDLEGSGPEDHGFVLDPESGVVRFGDGVIRAKSS